MLTAGAFFFLSLLGIGALFHVKYLETRGIQVVHPAFHARFDAWALRLKDYLHGVRARSGSWPFVALGLIRTVVHVCALGLARLARMTERGAHRVADFVSHKRGFDRRETRSEFLKQVTEHKNNTDFDACT
jgi:hypothetical protein